MSPLNLATTITALYGVIAAAGGLTGYIKAGSLASLIAGGVSGLLLLGAAAWMRNTKAGGLILAQVVAIALFIRFVPGAVNTQKPLAVGMSLGALLVLGTTSRALRRRMQATP